MFGQNKIIGRKFFKDQSASRTKLLVTSVFSTLQGEGPLAGMPAVFVRLAHCNLNCSFCDTYFDHGEWMSLPQLHDEINAARERTPSPPRLNQMALIITGGEPTLQPALKMFLEYFESSFLRTQIESNGLLHSDLADYTMLIVSPKCRETSATKKQIAGKERVAGKYLRPNVDALGSAYCLKFVISSDVNSSYHTIPQWAFEWQYDTGREIYISPMNEYNQTPDKALELYNKGREASLVERSTIGEKISFWDPGLLNLYSCQKNHEYAAMYCMEHGLRLSLQMHLFASLP